MQARKRAQSPVGRKMLFVGDVSGARKAGKAENQEMQKPYVNKFLKTLESAYPENTRICPVECKTAVYIIPVHCFNPSADFVSIGNKVKKEFPQADCQAKSGTEYVWKLPYIEPGIPIQWGAVIFWFLVIVFILGVGSFYSEHI